jgi:hypothetical protein
MHWLKKRLSMGVYPTVSRAQSREAREQARRKLAAGVDPSAEKKEARAARAVAETNTFEAEARVWHAFWSVNKSERHAGYVLTRLEADAFTELGAMPLDGLTAPHFIRMIRKIEERGAGFIAKRVYQTCNQVMRYAVVNGLRDRNPCADVKPSDAPQPRDKGHFARNHTDHQAGPAHAPTEAHQVEHRQAFRSPLFCVLVCRIEAHEKCRHHQKN